MSKALLKLDWSLYQPRHAEGFHELWEKRMEYGCGDNRPEFVIEDGFEFEQIHYDITKTMLATFHKWSGCYLSSLYLKDHPEWEAALWDMSGYGAPCPLFCWYYTGDSCGWSFLRQFWFTPAYMHEAKKIMENYK